MINKIVKSLKDAVANIHDDSTIMIGGFGEAGSPVELIHALNFNKEYTYAYWMKLSSYNFIIWLIFLLLTLIGLILCRKNFIITKLIWNEVMEEIKTELKK